MPLVHRCRGIDCNLFRLCRPPATFSVRKELVNNPRVVTVDSTTVSAMQTRPCFVQNTHWILSVWSPICAVPCALVLVARR